MRQQHYISRAHLVGVSLFFLWLVQSSCHFVRSEAANGANYTRPTYQNASAFKTIRFRDFEPRFSRMRDDTTAFLHNVRRPRGFHFHADNKDVVVDLEFILPFVRIPIERSMAVTTSTFRNLVNLNTGSLLATGAFVAVGLAMAGVIKVFSSSLSPPAAVYGYRKEARGADELANFMEPFQLVSYERNYENNSLPQTKSETKVNDLFTLLQSKLLEYNIDFGTCIQHAICSHVEKAASGVRMGQGSPTEKIIDGFANLEMLQEYLQGTAVKDAIDAGSGTRGCDAVYSRCKWSKFGNTTMKVIMKYLHNT